MLILHEIIVDDSQASENEENDADCTYVCTHHLCNKRFTSVMTMLKYLASIYNTPEVLALWGPCEPGEAIYRINYRTIIIHYST
jgi:hypothetical protein